MVQGSLEWILKCKLNIYESQIIKDNYILISEHKDILHNKDIDHGLNLGDLEKSKEALKECLENVLEINKGHEPNSIQLSIDELTVQFEHNFNNMDLSKDSELNYIHYDTRIKWIGYYRCAVNNDLVKDGE